MLDIDHLREVMQQELLKDKAQKSIEVWGASVEEALKQAAIEFNMPTHFLAYETLIRGYKGVLGTFFKKEWLILVYPAANYSPTKLNNAVSTNGTDEVIEEIVSKDGDFGLRMDKDGRVYLKVVPPIGFGQPTSFEKIMQQSSSIRNMPDVSESLVQAALSAEANEWVAVANFDYNYQADSDISVTISEDEMRASLTFSTPGFGGSTPTAAEMKESLRNAGVFLVSMKN